VTSFLVKH